MTPCLLLGLVLDLNSLFPGGDVPLGCVCAEQAIKIVRGMSSAEVMEPEPALFQVETSLRSGRPPRWTLNGEVLAPSQGVRMDRDGTVHSLCFTATDSSMSGPVVFATGKSHCSGKLTVKGGNTLMDGWMEGGREGGRDDSQKYPSMLRMY